MSMKAFLASVALLQKEIPAQENPVSYFDYGISHSISTANSVNGAHEKNSLDAKIDDVINYCNALIESHTKARDIICSAGVRTSNSKAENASMIKENNKAKANMETEALSLQPPIDEYAAKEKRRENERDALDALNGVIAKRNKSKDYLIPFYGIKFASDTLKMIREYNRRVRDWNALNEWLNENRSDFNRRTSILRGLESKIEELKGQNDRLQREGGIICEVLTLLGQMIYELENFRVGISSAKTTLQYTFFENPMEGENLLGSALGMIKTLNDTLESKLGQSLVELSEEGRGKVLKLIAS